MRRFVFIFLLVISGSPFLRAQSLVRSAASETPVLRAYAIDGLPNLALTPAPPPALAPAVALPRMSGDLALLTYQQNASRQAQTLAAYSAATLIRADLPDNAQHGEYELVRRYTAPHSLTFKSVRFQGDGFVKTNVIARLLQSEVDHVEKDDPAATALRPENYKFSYKGIVQDGDRTLHVYQVKPSKKRIGLFKGHIFLDATTGRLVRVEGRVAKSPSLFVKKIEFVQEYAEINGFTLPVHMHSEAKVALVGRTVVDITIRDYQPMPAAAESAAISGTH